MSIAMINGFNPIRRYSKLNPFYNKHLTFWDNFMKSVFETADKEKDENVTFATLEIPETIEDAEDSRPCTSKTLKKR